MQKKISPWIVAAAVLSGTFMEVLDTSVANVSLPHIAGSLLVTPDEAAWVLTSYLVSNGIVLPVAAWLSSRFGRRRYFLFSILLFTVSSALCGAAPSLRFLIFFRILQGLGGGGLQPNSQAILLETFPPEKRGQAMATYGLGIVLAPMLGPVLGGWITDNYSWRWIFYINLPVGLLAFLLVTFFVFDPPYLKRTKDPADLIGFGFLVLGIGALQYMLDRGQEKDWLNSPLISRLLIICIVAMIFYLAWELWVPHPITDLRILKDRTFAAGCLLITFLFQGLYGSLVTLPLFLQELLGYSSLQAGLATFPRGFGTFAGMPLAGVLLKYVDARYLIFFGAAGASYSMYVLSHLNLQTGYWNIFWPQFWQGVSMSFLFVPLTTATFAFISKEKMGNATSLYSLVRNIGGSIGIAIATTLLERGAQSHQVHLGTHLASTNPKIGMMLAMLSHYFVIHGLHPAQSHFLATRMLYNMLLQQAALMSYLDNFRIFAAIFLPFLPLVFLMKKTPR